MELKMYRSETPRKSTEDVGAWAVLFADLEEWPVLSAQTRLTGAGRLVPLPTTRSGSVSANRTAHAPTSTQPKAEFRPQPIKKYNLDKESAHEKSTNNRRQTLHHRKN